MILYLFFSPEYGMVQGRTVLPSGNTHDYTCRNQLTDVIPGAWPKVLWQRQLPDVTAPPWKKQDKSRKDGIGGPGLTLQPSRNVKSFFKLPDCKAQEAALIVFFGRERNLVLSVGKAATGRTRPGRRSRSRRPERPRQELRASWYGGSATEITG
ncbi:hypothetical protein MAPG_00696 [Magnaporthiopsis poae ATCC 64411]|uniref:Uncharacterized protein n=1 Tax=Magnaporthiopsis poae (strain ATCC 64411 / 73-15) TaxID=644358 RepID=A0A0C4DLQ1_MAGP6|nr:hypothetical protein MAPG_00696 [Magnaporthiopsis poae ATCC 64411]